MNMKVVLDEGAYMPERAHGADAGADLRSPVDALVPPGGSVVIDTGVHMEIPSGFAGIMVAKSGLNVKHGILNTGLVDAGYTGSVHVKLYNHGNDYFKVERGDKIGQIVIVPVMLCGFEKVDKLGPTERGDGRFGSTGK